VIASFVRMNGCSVPVDEMTVNLVRKRIVYYKKSETYEQDKVTVEEPLFPG
jgi:hypothetical protein